MKRLIFLDVDGTLCDNSGKIPFSARAAVEKARKNGHKVFLCTGRSKPEITEEIRSIGLDGVIGAAGGYIEIDNQIVLHKRMDEADVQEIVDFFHQHEIAYYLECNSGLYASSNCQDKIMAVATNGVNHHSAEYQKIVREVNWFLQLLKPIETKKTLDDINKISFLNNTIPLQKVVDTFGGKHQIYPSTVPQFGKDSGEISIVGITKKTAIEHILQHLNFPVSHTMAYGDSFNDIEMFDAVGYRVAMGNAVAELKAKADEITGRPEEDGIQNSFLKNKLISL